MTTRLAQIWREPLALLAVSLGVALTGCHAIDLYTPSLQAPFRPRRHRRGNCRWCRCRRTASSRPTSCSIELLKAVPRPPYRVEAYDVLQIDVAGTMPGQPINGYFLVEGDGIVTLGPAYGVVRVEGMTIDEATDAVTRQLQMMLQRPAVSIRLSRSADLRGGHAAPTWLDPMAR